MQVQVWTGSKYVPEGAITQSDATPLQVACAEKLAAIDRTYFENLAQGYPDAVTNITLAATQNDQNQFGNLVTMLMLAETPGTETITFADHQGVFQQLPYTGFRALMIAYAEWCKATWGGAVYAKQLCAAATTVEEVEAVLYE